jgi:hypothetical protein
LLAASTIHSTNNPVHIYPIGTGYGSTTRVYFLRQSDNGPGIYDVFAGALADTYVTRAGTWVNRYVKVTGLSHRSSTSYLSYIQFLVMQ